MVTTDNFQYVCDELEGFVSLQLDIARYGSDMSMVKYVGIPLEVREAGSKYQNFIDRSSSLC